LLIKPRPVNLDFSRGRQGNFPLNLGHHQDFFEKTLPNLRFSGEVFFETRGPVSGIFSVDHQGNTSGQVAVNFRTSNGKYTISGKTQLPLFWERTFEPRSLSCLSFTLNGAGDFSLGITVPVLSMPWGKVGISGKARLSNRNDLPRVLGLQAPNHSPWGLDWTQRDGNLWPVLRPQDPAHALWGDGLLKGNGVALRQLATAKSLPGSSVLLGTRDSLFLIPEPLVRSLASRSEAAARAGALGPASFPPSGTVEPLIGWRTYLEILGDLPSGAAPYAPVNPLGSERLSDRMRDRLRPAREAEASPLRSDRMTDRSALASPAFTRTLPPPAPLHPPALTDELLMKELRDLLKASGKPLASPPSRGEDSGFLDLPRVEPAEPRPAPPRPEA
jgi:hypothetical protein